MSGEGAGEGVRKESGEGGVEVGMESRAGIVPGSFRAWVLASRPATLSAAAVPVAVGTACAVAVGEPRVGPAVAALMGALLIQIGTNFANDVADFEKGADTGERLGPTRAVQAGLLSGRQVWRGMVAAFGLASLVGVYLAGVAGWPIVLIGLASIASGIAYTAGPFPLGYHGLGDLFVFVFFGIVAVCGTTFVQTGNVPAIAAWASIPIGALSTAILVVNNVRDRETDVKVGKRTLAVRFGRRCGIGEYIALSLTAAIVPVWLYLSGAFSLPVLLPLLTAPWSARLVRLVSTAQGRVLNAGLVGTAKLLLVYGLLLSLGLVLGRQG